jgi:hypothetical protein
MIHEVEEGKEYALLMSTNAGAWRYLLGDTIKFTDLEKSEVVITGRIKHFLSPYRGTPECGKYEQGDRTGQRRV